MSKAAFLAGLAFHFGIFHGHAVVLTLASFLGYSYGAIGKKRGSLNENENSCYWY